ncbi:FIG121501: Prophage tail protein [Alloalcanivorax xenomutans]|uniref:putative phage tail protein n=1 Tax=Alloalcanivorax xenomutans TaxID=1094342 RepID=UPI0006D5C781|nr:putative phage tail protein [Alloalcanivorax xenomutans]CUR45496.1 FIG121501: Prophage tail protein [Alloalcanivorax xenomutans]
MNDFTNQLVLLQPPGIGLPTEPDSGWYQLLAGLAAEFERIDGRSADLTKEITLQPGAIELLDEWEDALGINDDPIVPTDPDDRRNNVVAKLSAIGGQTLAYFIGIAQRFGVKTSTVEERPFEMGVHGMGDPVGGDEWRHVWSVLTTDVVSSDVRAILERAINRYKPAHTVALFDYRLDSVGPSTDALHNIINFGLPGAVGSLS